MSDVTLKLFGVAMLTVAAVMVLRRGSPDMATVMRATVGIGLAVASITLMSPLVEYIGELSDTLGAGEGVASAVGVLLKALAISLLTHVCATVCNDCGEGSIAHYVELGGKIEILILALPLIREIIDLSLELLSMN